MPQCNVFKLGWQVFSEEVLAISHRSAILIGLQISSHRHNHFEQRMGTQHIQLMAVMYAEGGKANYELLE